MFDHVEMKCICSGCLSCRYKWPGELSNLRVSLLASSSCEKPLRLGKKKVPLVNSAWKVHFCLLNLFY